MSVVWIHTELEGTHHTLGLAEIASSAFSYYTDLDDDSFVSGELNSDLSVDLQSADLVADCSDSAEHLGLIAVDVLVSGSENYDI